MFYSHSKKQNTVLSHYKMPLTFEESYEVESDEEESPGKVFKALVEKKILEMFVQNKCEVARMYPWQMG